MAKSVTLTDNTFSSPRHTTHYWEAGPAGGPLMFFLHGWPEIGLVWRAQMEAFAAEGWHCIAPDMRGYGGSSVPDASEAYAIKEIVEDMVELHDHLGASPAIWVGHDLGSPVVGALAAHHAKRSRGVMFISVPYTPRGLRAAQSPAVHRPQALSRRSVSGRTMGLLPLLPNPFRPDGHRFRCRHPRKPRGDIPERKPRISRQGVPVCDHHAQWRLVRFGASRSRGRA